MDTSVLVYLVLTCFCPVLTQRPEIVEDILPQEEQLGGVAILNCTTINVNEANAKVTWEKVNGSLKISENTQIVLENTVVNGESKYSVSKIDVRNSNQDIYNLAIRRLEEEDSGKYKCYINIAEYDRDEWPERNTLLTIQGNSNPNTTENIIIQAGTQHTVSTSFCNNCVCRNDSPNITADIKSQNTLFFSLHLNVTTEQAAFITRLFQIQGWNIAAADISNTIYDKKSCTTGVSSARASVVVLVCAVLFIEVHYSVL